MTAEAVAHFVEATVDAIVADRASVPLRADIDERGAVFAAVAGELRALSFQVAEMAEHEPDQLLAACEYLHGLLEREPLRSNAAWEAQRVVLGLFLLGLTNALAATERIGAEQRAAVAPSYQRAAREAVTAAFDSTYVPPADPEADEEAVTSAELPAPESTDDDPFAFL